MATNGAVEEQAAWEPAPHERSPIPGSPPTPWHPLPRRIAYFSVAVLVVMSGSLGNAIVTANLTTLQGSLGLYSAEIQWLPTVYVMTNVCANMLLIKFRQQFGIRLFTQIFLIGFALTTGAHIFTHSFATAVAVRALSGIAAAACSTVGLLYMVQAWTPEHRLKGIVLAVSLPQTAVPLARLFPTEVFEADRWQSLYLFELGLALFCLAGVRLLVLPPVERMKAFEPLDFVTFPIFATGIALLCAVLGLGRTLWWFEAPWIAPALIGAIVLIPTALVIEHNRRNPLLNTRWLGSGAIVRFALVSILARVVLSEQTIGASGLLAVVGMGNDQLRMLYAVVLVATLAGAVIGAMTIDPTFLGKPILIALALICVGALLDSDSTNLIRPHDMYFSQALLGFASALFIGPALLVGLTRALREGPTHFVSFSALFGITQNLGGLFGSAMLGTFQVIREHAHNNAIVAGLMSGDPLVAQRLQQNAAAYGRVLVDPGLRQAEGAAILSQTVTREANILAYNDTFLLIAAIAAGTILWASVHIMRIRRETLARIAAEQQAQAGAQNG
ncbi:MFS family permease [Sphingomonas kyeonggiensis]|uniref:MFS transporter n=1 Tax=Sphingomonas kyeonggiensis TaxID=1268553 RepID=UPI002788F5ED|nr:MFS transporter [Sphingomonas kyeonggiensis]MDQ0249245.1 MFS family permease [Sphingomonas kyeonggiensis]